MPRTCPAGDFLSDGTSASMVNVMGHAGAAAAAVRYLRSAGAPAPVEALPRPELRCVGEDGGRGEGRGGGEGGRPPVDRGESRRALAPCAAGVTVIPAPAADGEDN